VLSTLDDDVMMYALNKFVGWDWFGRTLNAKEYPPFAESSGSKRVDAALVALFSTAVQESSGWSLQKVQEVMGDKQKRAHHVIDDNVDATTCAMVRTIVSRSPDLRAMLQKCTLQHRIEALLHMQRACFAKVMRANSISHSRKQRFERCSAMIDGRIQPYLLPDTHPRAIANDLDTVRTVTNTICAHVSHREGWHPNLRSRADSALEDDGDETDPLHVQAVLRKFLHDHLHFPSLRALLSSYSSDHDLNELHVYTDEEDEFMDEEDEFVDEEDEFVDEEDEFMDEEDEFTDEEDDDDAEIVD
jgi:hypothetical protein